jgi:hypothetical protein
MIIQVLLSAGLLLSAVYFQLSGIGSRCFGAVVYATILGGLLIVWRPDLASVAANAVGVGRGSDLLFYCWVMISFVFVVNLHLKQRETRALMTELVRHLAIANAVYPERDGGAADPVPDQKRA